MPETERIVAIVGRPNVGKSALFNRLAGRQIAIVHDEPGVTRDRITATCNLGSSPYTIIDTGGIGSNVDETFSAQVRREADIAMGAAHVILFVLDGAAGLHPVDRDLAKVLRRADSKVIAVVNKIDHDGRTAGAAEFGQLGFDEFVEISAAHGRGMGELVERIDSSLPEAAPVEVAGTSERPFRVAVVGRPNVGKSSLINAILSDDRTIVSEVAGTTRDAVDIPYVRGSRNYELIDTAGIRPRSRHRTSVEVFSVMRSEKSVRRADLCVLVLDAGQGVTMQDKKIAGLIQECRRPCILVMNKWDLVDPGPRRKDVLAKIFDDIRADLFFIPYAPIVVVSAKRGTHLARLFNTVESVRKAAATHIGTGPLNRFVEKAVLKHPPPMRKGRRLKILYATQADGGKRGGLGEPIRIVLFVNSADNMDDSYARYLEGCLREEWNCEGVPIKFELRGRQEKAAPPHKER